MPFAQDQLLPISALQHLLFCERQCALIHIEQVWSDNQFTAEGNLLHERTHDGPDESRPGVRITRGLPVRSLQLGLSGQCDVVEFHESAGRFGSLNTNAANRSRTGRTKCSSARRRFASKKCCKNRLRAAHSFMANAADTRLSFSTSRFAVLPAKRRGDYTPSSLRGLHPRRCARRNATAARYSRSACRTRFAFVAALRPGLTARFTTRPKRNAPPPEHPFCDTRRRLAFQGR